MPPFVVESSMYWESFLIFAESCQIHKKPKSNRSPTENGENVKVNEYISGYLEIMPIL